jgi:hypothetical protein
MTAIQVALLLMPTFLPSAFAYGIIHHLPRRSLPSSPSPRIRSMVMSSSSSLRSVDTPHPYRPPTFVEGVLANVPKRGRLHLANLPTPIHLVRDGSRTAVAGSSSRRPGDDDDGGGGSAKDGNGGGILSRLNELNARLYVKRDDATGGAELGGNKVRKLEFLLADALAEGCDSVVTIGGEQSNHCRATAAARYGFGRVFAMHQSTSWPTYPLFIEPGGLIYC